MRLSAMIPENIMEKAVSVTEEGKNCDMFYMKQQYH